MIRVNNLEKTINFFTEILNLKIVRTKEFPKEKFTLIFLEAPDGGGQIELTYNHDETNEYTNGTNFGHLAFEVENIYQTCEKLQNHNIVILRPPRDGKMAFIKTPDNISIELLQSGDPLPPQKPWTLMKNTGSW